MGCIGAGNVDVDGMLNRTTRVRVDALIGF
jgi:hypothetical protein